MNRSFQSCRDVLLDDVGLARRRSRSSARSGSPLLGVMLAVDRRQQLVEPVG